MNFLDDIHKRWSEVRWIPPLFTLFHHSVHILGGIAFAAILNAFGLGLLEATTISAVILTAVEWTTAIVKKNWKDSAFDALQYNFQWFVYLAHIDIVAGVAALTGLLILYFVALKAGW